MSLPANSLFDLFSLPLELRQHVYSYILPSDHSQEGSNISILLANRRIHDEAIPVLFANLTILIRVECDCVLIKPNLNPMHRLHPRTKGFPEAFGRNLCRVQKVSIHIGQNSPPNEKTPNVFSFENQNRLRGQVEMLCVGLKRMERIRSLEAYIWPRPLKDQPFEEYMKILEALEHLGNVERAAIIGRVNGDAFQAFSDRVGGSWTKEEKK